MECMIVSDIAGLVSQIIPADHVSSFLHKGHFFAQCSSFVDMMEFRYGYCLFNSGASTPAEVQTCVQRTFSNLHINRCIESACISCWTRRRAERPESCAMWEVYGKGQPAIQVTVEAKRFFDYIKDRHPHCVGGNVTYDGQFSTINPQMWEPGLLTDEQRQQSRSIFSQARLLRLGKRVSHSHLCKPAQFNLLYRTVNKLKSVSVTISPCGELTGRCQAITQ